MLPDKQELFQFILPLTPAMLSGKFAAMSISFSEFCKRGREARQKKVSPARRKEIASLAAKSRWAKKPIPAKTK